MGRQNFYELLRCVDTACTQNDRQPQPTFSAKGKVSIRSGLQIVCPLVDHIFNAIVLRVTMDLILHSEKCSAGTREEGFHIDYHSIPVYQQAPT